ncbi:hypothetical protein [Kitasatospora cathayae]|uniref:Lipoprotein LpqN n=1 Tax=Kitasatospora cathayae TaxID=3004092 RepID=A0ABY7PXW7_9ACTN|nr:hypothetical protein [Kitasatospora sp. HUAS 3-15]WBP85219.1 hypothetical protein O1G21_04690 [Kitasatospora sp. HUAS 3-15]
MPAATSRRTALPALAVVVAAVVIGVGGCGSGAARHDTAATGYRLTPTSTPTLLTPSGSTPTALPTPAEAPTPTSFPSAPDGTGPSATPSAVPTVVRPPGAAGGGSAPVVPHAPAAKNTPAPVVSKPTGLDVQLAGLPAQLKTGGAPVEFSAVFTDRTGGGLSSITPTLQISGTGAASSVSRLNPATGGWVSEAADDTSSAPIGVAPGASSYAVPAGGALTVRYRISLPASSRSQQVQVFLYAVGADGRQLATATQSVAVTTG